jgi:hypothetical protein
MVCKTPFLDIPGRGNAMSKSREGVKYSIRSGVKNCRQVMQMTLK